MERIEIETYKNQTIYYNEDSDKFECDIEFDDAVRGAKRGSLTQLRIAIDQFERDNKSFKPFKVFEISWNSFKVVEFTAIRTDGTYVVDDGGRSKSYVKPETAKKNYRKFDAEIEKEIRQAEAESEAARKKCVAKLKELGERMKPLSI
jgi:hypothetical protein